MPVKATSSPVVRRKPPHAIHFTVPWVPPTTLGQNAHKHWRSKAPDEKNAYIIGSGAVRGTRYTKADVPEMPVLVWVIHWDKASRRKDDDNALGTLKHLRDGICAGLGLDDRVFVTSMAFQRIDPNKKGFTEVFIRSANAEERKMLS